MADGATGRTPNLSEVVASLLIGGVGVFFIVGAFDYRIGTIRSMGSGYFPLLLGIALTGLAALLLVSALLRPEAGEAKTKILWRPIVAVMVGIVLFGFTITKFGLLPATGLAVGTAAAGNPNARLWPTLILVAVTLAGVYLVFLKGLGVTAPAFRLPS